MKTTFCTDLHQVDEEFVAHPVRSGKGLPIQVIQFSEQLFSNFSGAGAHGRLVVSTDLAQIRVWGPRVLSILESSETRYWRDQSLGALFSGVVAAVGYFFLDWSLGMLILFWTCDLLAVWLGDVLKAMLAPRQLEMELADAERNFEITYLLSTLRRGRTRPDARPPRIAPDRLSPEFSARSMLRMPAYILLWLGILTMFVFLHPSSSIDWWVLAPTSGAFVIHLTIAIRDWRQARDKETPQPQLLALSYLPATIFAVTFVVFLAVFIAVLILQDLVRLDLIPYLAGCLVTTYAATAVTLFWWLIRTAKWQARELRYYLSKSTQLQESELRLMQGR